MTDAFPIVAAAVAKRLEPSAASYDNVSFIRDPAELVSEIE